MRRHLSGRTGMVLAFLLGLVIATAGTAGAARLITGKQIKDGSISARDLNKAVRDQLKKAGVPGPQGPKGETGSAGPAGLKGDPGPFPSGDLPANVTLRGDWALFAQKLTLGGAPNSDIQTISFGFQFASAPAPHVVIRNPLVPTPECPGTVANPQATSGHLCLYVQQTSVNARAGPVVFSTVTRQIGADRWGFALEIAADIDEEFAFGTWAATSP